MTDEPTTVGGRYELGDTLGRGGMAEVRHAIDRRLGRPVAVKQLRADLATDPTFQARFRREAQSAAGLNHPTIVAVYDTGEEPDPITGVSIPYIVMELVEGSTLRDVLRDGRKILPERALELTQGVLDALGYSHKAGIIHRDIKPANVMLTPTGGVKVMDFGIARAVADTSATMTQTAAVIGTAQYLSPEQARGETVDARSDIYSAGCLLYELLVGRPPFIGDSPVSVAYQHVREIPVPPSQLDPVVTPAIDAITLKALAKDPDDRYQSAREMKADIARVLAGQQATAVVPRIIDVDPTPTRVVPAPMVAAPVVVETEETEDEEPRRSRIGLGIFITGLVLLVLAGGAYGLYQMMTPDTPAPVTPTPGTSTRGTSTRGTSTPGTSTPATPPTSAPAAQVEVPTVLTYTKQQATDQIKAKNLKVVPKTTNGDQKTMGQVVKQDPTGGTRVDVRSTVTITVNVGPKTAKIPTGLINRDLQEVKKALADAGFSNVNTEAAKTEPGDAGKDQVLSVSPGEGESAALDDAITVTYATGESTVPDLTGRLQAKAEDDARAAGFKTNVVTQESDEPEGIVLQQDPQSGTSMRRGKTITLTVAKPRPVVTPPPVTPPPTTATPDPTVSPSATPTDTASPR